MYSKEHPEFLIVTRLEWKHVLKQDLYKDIIINSLIFLSKQRMRLLVKNTNKGVEHAGA